MRRPGRAADAGFTLIELLVAITLLGLLSGFLAMGVRVIVRGFDTVHEEATEVAALEQAERVLTRYLGAARPVLVWPEEGGAPGLDFLGEPDRLGFRTFLAPELGGWDARFSLGLEAGEAGEAAADLVLMVEGAAGPPEAERFVLLEGVSELSLAYWGAPADADEPDWQESWPNARWLPELVRIDVRQGDRALPTFMVALPIDTE